MKLDGFPLLVLLSPSLLGPPPLLQLHQLLLELVVDVRHVDVLVVVNAPETAQNAAKSVIWSEWVAIGWSASLIFFLVNARPAHSPRVAAPVLLDVKVLDHLLEKVWVAKGLSFSNVVDQVPALERQRVRGGGVTPGSPAKEEKISSVSKGGD